MTSTATGTAKYEPEQVWLPASEQLLEWDASFHDLLLGDEIRMAAFRAAIAETVQPDMTVLDLGTGTGILALWALEAGADRVYGIDFNASVLQTATERVVAAGYGKRFHPICGVSFDVSLPERVDVVVSETMGNLADNEGFVAILADARYRLLAEGGLMVPSRVESYLVPVAAERAHEQVSRGTPADAGDPALFTERLRRRGARSVFDLYYDVIIPVDTYLATPRVARLYDFAASTGIPPTAASYQVPLTYTVQRDGLLTGFKGYFVATLSHTVALDISSDDIAGRATSDSWKHCYLPIAKPVAVRRGDRIGLTFSRSCAGGAAGPFRQSYQWDGQVISQGTPVARFAQSTTEIPQ
ncbi:MAG: methyltransferase domain-containing protein [Pseudonocardiaceae bacterium]